MTQTKQRIPEREATIDPSPPLATEDGADLREPVPALGFPIVGIGASAGGLAAFEAFFSGMPADADPGMAFVLVQQLAPVNVELQTKASVISSALINKAGKLYAIATTERAIHGGET